MRPGKLEYDFLKNRLLKHLGYKSEDLILGPGLGLDSAILKVSNDIAFHLDPITGAKKEIGKLAIMIASNDIVAAGGIPRFATLCMLMPLNSSREETEEIQIQASRKAEELRIAIVGGHVEFTDAVKNKIVIVSMIGEMIEGYERRLEELRRIRDNPEEYIIIQVKPLALEATAILANDYEDMLSKEISYEEIKRAKSLIDALTIYREGITLFEKDLIIYAHDPTEGGIMAALKEISELLKVGLEVEEEKMIIAEITKKILSVLNLDPLKSLSSGCILCIAKKENGEEILSLMKNLNTEASIIGKFTKNRNIIKRLNGEEIDLRKIDEKEELWKLFNFNL